MISILKKTFEKQIENPAFILSMGFFILITIGGIILSTPFVTKSGEATRILDAFFVATSASCVTGLSPFNTAEYWNLFGQIVILILIQIGGLGIMTLATVVPLILGKKIGIKSRLLLKEQLNVENISGLIKLFRYVLLFTLLCEGIGAILLSFRFIPDYGLKTGLYYSIFHSISAFCNAGFDVLGDSIYPLRNDFLVNITLMSLIVIGGLGFMVTSEILTKKNFEKLSTHSKLVLTINLILILVGAFGFFFLEFYEGGILSNEKISNGLLQSFFQSISARTAGFYSVDLSKLKDTTSLLLIGLMFIGGSPGSTAGGIKTTTFGVLLFSTLSVIKNQKELVLYKRTISDENIKKALSIFFISFFIVLLVSFVISFTDNFKYVDILYETASALGTVGATKGLTAKLSDIAKFLIMLCMYLGRIGPMTMALAFGLKDDERMIRYPRSFISLG